MIDTTALRRLREEAKRALLCGCEIQRVSVDSLVVGLCELHEEYPTWLDGTQQYEDAVAHRFDCDDDNCRGECGR